LQRLPSGAALKVSPGLSEHFVPLPTSPLRPIGSPPGIKDLPCQTDQSALLARLVSLVGAIVQSR